MKTLIQIEAQYYENYGFYDGTEHWKAKGGQTFTLRADSDLFFYEEDLCIKAIKSMLEEKCDTLNRYEYVSHELMFSEPIELDDIRFENLFNQHSQDKYKLSLVDGHGRETTLGKILEEGDYEIEY